jgi:hypothetical protein
MDGGGRIASGTAIESTNSRRLRRCRSNCRGHEVYYYFLRVLRVLCGESFFQPSVANHSLSRPIYPLNHHNPRKSAARCAEIGGLPLI